MSPVTHRDFSGDDDFIAVRQFLVDSYLGYDRLFNWGSARWDVVRYSGNAAAELSGERDWELYVQIWEDDGRIVGVVHPEDGGDVHVEIDADYRRLENDMYEWAEENRSPARRDAVPYSTWSKARDSHRRTVLRSRGWRYGGPDGYTRYRSLKTPLPAGPVPSGYTVRAVDLTDDTDAVGRASVSRASFGNHRTAELMKVLRLAPSYRPDLDLAVIAGDGTFAAYTTVWLDEVNRFVVFEPVGTHPDHRRQGLASAVIAEGMRRAVEYGAKTAYVGSGASSPANRLYELMGFLDADLDEIWHLPT